MPTRSLIAPFPIAPCPITPHQAAAAASHRPEGFAPSGTAADLSAVDLVIAPLIGRDLDAVELIGRLGRSRFRGRLRVIAPRLADRRMVLGELRALAEPLGIGVDLSDRR